MLTEGGEAFEVQYQFDTYDPHCDSPDTLMHFDVKTVDYNDHFYPLLQEYFSHQRFQHV
ncbi:MAG: hypothetical protein ACFFAE_08950 [Candidatus Hodarchaeota archaeon]